MPHQGSSINPTATSLKQKGESWMAQEILKFKKNSLYLGNNTLIGMLIGSQVSSSETDTWWRPSWVIWRGRLSYQKYLAVKCAVPHEECGWGTHLPYLGREPVGGLLPKSVTCCHLDTRPFQPQSISTSGIELYCLMTTEARVQTSCPQLLPESGTAGNRTCHLWSCMSNSPTIAPSDHEKYLQGRHFKTYGSILGKRKWCTSHMVWKEFLEWTQ